MPHGEASELIPAPREAVFDLVHDYARRLEWDTLLKAAWLENGAQRAGVGVTSVCVGKNALLGLALRTIYVSFDPPRVAAVKMVNHPPFFRAWAATILHEEISPRESRITYKFQFTTKPGWLAFVLDPVMGCIFRHETRRRLQRLRDHFAR